MKIVVVVVARWHSLPIDRAIGSRRALTLAGQAGREKKLSFQQHVSSSGLPAYLLSYLLLKAYLLAYHALAVYLCACAHVCVCVCVLYAPRGRRANKRAASGLIAGRLSVWRLASSATRI